MKFARNIVVGIASSVWTGLLGLLVIPLYVKFLGIESYGLIGFHATTQVLLQLLDMGLAPTINRELARCSASGKMDEARGLMFTLGVVYLATAVLVVLLVLALAPQIASHWLQSDRIDQQTLTHAVMLMGLVIGCRWPLGLYQGALMGMQRLSVSASVNAVMLTVANVGAIAVLAFVSPTIEAFFVWQAAAALGHVLVMRYAARKVLAPGGVRKFDVASLRRIWRFSAGMTGIAISSIVLTQLDKVILSKMLSLADFGKYTLAGVVASGLYVLLTPVFHVVYPRMSALVAVRDEAHLLELYKTGGRLLNSVLLPIALSAALYSEDLLYFWTGNPELARSVSPIASLLLLGTACNGVMHFPYALQLASGLTRLPFVITTSLAVLLAPLIILLTFKLGALGSAAAWLCVNLTYVFVGSWLTHRHLLKGHGAGWLAQDVGIPFAITAAVTCLGWTGFRIEGAHAQNLLLACGFGILAILVNCACLPRTGMDYLRRISFPQVPTQRPL